MTAMGHPSSMLHPNEVTKSNQGILPRALSSLELLSQTAIEIESANSSPRSLIYSRASSPPALSVVSEALVLPEMVHKSAFVGSPGSTSPLDENNKALKNHSAPLMLRPSLMDQEGSLATLMREPSGLYVTLMGGSHPGVGGNIQSFPNHIYRSSSFSSSCAGATGATESSSTTATASHHPSENAWLRQQLAAKDSTIATLQIQVQNLTQEIRQLRQLPTGKISQIPLE
jgi:hypothetical protein